jgi:hypothetical protein
MLRATTVSELMDILESTRQLFCTNMRDSN